MLCHYISHFSAVPLGRLAPRAQKLNVAFEQSSLGADFTLLLLPTQTNIEPPSIAEIDGVVGLAPMETE